jgi:hypothetical protein
MALERWMKKHKQTDEAPRSAKPPGPPIRANWLPAWQELAQLTRGITEDDPRFPDALTALDLADESFLADDWASFQRAKTEIIKIVGIG